MHDTDLHPTHSLGAPQIAMKTFLDFAASAADRWCNRLRVPSRDSGVELLYSSLIGFRSFRNATFRDFSFRIAVRGVVSPYTHHAPHLLLREELHILSASQNPQQSEWLRLC